MKLHWRSPVLRASTPVRTGEGEGSVQGTGRFRLYVWTRTVSERSWKIGVAARSGGYIERLTEQGWRMGAFGASAGHRSYEVAWKITDEEAMWNGHGWVAHR